MVMTFARTRRWPSSNRTAMVSSLRRCRVRVVRVLIVTLQDHVAQSPNGGRRLPFLGMRRVGGVCNGCYSLGLPPPPCLRTSPPDFQSQSIAEMRVKSGLGSGGGLDRSAEVRACGDTRRGMGARMRRRCAVEHWSPEGLEVLREARTTYSFSCFYFIRSVKRDVWETGYGIE
jgi:hypothetical protein